MGYRYTEHRSWDTLSPYRMKCLELWASADGYELEAAAGEPAEAFIVRVRMEDGTGWETACLVKPTYVEAVNEVAEVAKRLNVHALDFTFEGHLHSGAPISAFEQGYLLPYDGGTGR